MGRWYSTWRIVAFSQNERSAVMASSVAAGIFELVREDARQRLAGSEYEPLGTNSALVPGSRSTNGER